MPQYIFQHPDTQEVREVFQQMNDEHVFSTEENGRQINWKRVFTIPKASFNTKINAESPADFVNSSANKRGTLGDLQDLSRELSEKRAEKYDGQDPVKRKYFDQYARLRGGKKHAKDKPDKIENSVFKLDL